MIDWRKEFGVTALGEGLRLNEENRTDILSSMPDHCEGAVYDDGDLYDVSLFFNAEGVVVERECTCVNGLRGKACRHEASVLQKLESEGFFEQFEMKDETQEENLEERLKNCSDDMIRQFLYVYLKKDAEMRAKFMALTAFEKNDPVPAIKEEKKAEERESQEVKDFRRKVAASTRLGDMRSLGNVIRRTILSTAMKEDADPALYRYIDEALKTLYRNDEKQKKRMVEWFNSYRGYGKYPQSFTAYVEHVLEDL